MGNEGERETFRGLKKVGDGSSIGGESARSGEAVMAGALVAVDSIALGAVGATLAAANGPAGGKAMGKAPAGPVETVDFAASTSFDWTFLGWDPCDGATVVG